MFNAILFDLDGLLIDSEIVSFKIYQTILSSFDIPFSQAEYAKDFSGKSEIHNLSLLIERYQLPFDITDGLKLVKELEKQYDFTLKKGAKALLDFCKQKNYKLAVASSSTRQRAINILTKHNIVDHFDAFVFSEDIEKGKPNPDIFLKAAEKLNIPFNHCLVLEDSEAGIEAAHRANIPVICIPDLKIPAPVFLKKCEAVLNSLEEMIDYLHLKNEL